MQSVWGFGGLDGFGCSFLSPGEGLYSLGLGCQLPVCLLQTGPMRDCPCCGSAGGGDQSGARDCLHNYSGKAVGLSGWPMSRASEWTGAAGLEERKLLHELRREFFVAAHGLTRVQYSIQYSSTRVQYLMH